MKKVTVLVFLTAVLSFGYLGMPSLSTKKANAPAVIYEPAMKDTDLAILKESIQSELKQQLKAELEQELRNELKEELRNDLTETIQAELSDEAYTIQAELESTLMALLNQEVQSEITTLQDQLSISESQQLQSNEQMVIDLVKAKMSSVIGVSNYERNLGTYTEASTGSGVIFKQEGSTYYLITNEHVVRDADRIRIVTSDSQSIDATLIDADTSIDLALLKFNSNLDFQVSYFANTDQVEIGQLAIAIGNPLGYQFYQSVTLGIVSGLNRFVSSEYSLDNYIQHDASISPGNSGGPLYNINGEVIGINSMKVIETHASNINFAIASNTVIEFIQKNKIDL